jgi:hypothetical protein
MNEPFLSKVSRHAREVYMICAFLAFCTLTSSCTIGCITNGSVPVRQLTWERFLNSSLTFKDCFGYFLGYAVLGLIAWGIRRISRRVKA